LSCGEIFAAFNDPMIKGYFSLANAMGGFWLPANPNRLIVHQSMKILDAIDN